jgi:hypothetical protein
VLTPPPADLFLASTGRGVPALSSAAAGRKQKTVVMRRRFSPLWSRKPADFIEPSCHSDDLTKLSKPDRSLCSYRCATGENMNLIGSLALIAVSVGLLFFGRGRDGDGLPFFQKSPWIVETLFAVAILYLFFAGLMGAAMNLNWLH